MKRCFAFLDKERLAPQIDRVLPLEAAAEAHTLLEARAAKGRIVLSVCDDF